MRGSTKAILRWKVINLTRNTKKAEKQAEFSTQKARGKMRIRVKSQKKEENYKDRN